MFASEHNFSLEVVDEGLSTQKFKSYIVSFYDEKARERLNQFKTKLLAELRQCISENKLPAKEERCPTLLFSDKIKTWFKNQNLSSEQQSDLAHFNKDKNGLLAAIYYLIAWENINNIYDRNSALACQRAFTRISTVKALPPNLDACISRCLVMFHEKNLDLIYQANITSADIVEILKQALDALNVDEQKKYEIEYHKKYIEAVKQYELYYSNNEEMDSKKDVILTANINQKLSIYFLANLFADSKPIDKYWTSQLISFHKRSKNQPNYKDFDINVIFEIDLHLNLLCKLNEKIYKKTIQAIVKLYCEKIAYSNLDFVLLKMRK